MGPCSGREGGKRDIPAHREGGEKNAPSIYLDAPWKNDLSKGLGGGKSTLGEKVEYFTRHGQKRPYSAITTYGKKKLVQRLSSPEPYRLFEW